MRAATGKAGEFKPRLKAGKIVTNEASSGQKARPDWRCKANPAARIPVVGRTFTCSVCPFRSRPRPLFLLSLTCCQRPKGATSGIISKHPKNALLWHLGRPGASFPNLIPLLLCNRVWAPQAIASLPLSFHISFSESEFESSKHPQQGVLRLLQGRAILCHWVLRCRVLLSSHRPHLQLRLVEKERDLRDPTFDQGRSNSPRDITIPGPLEALLLRKSVQKIDRALSLPYR